MISARFVLLLVFAVGLAVPRPAAAVGGFGGMKWGMERAEVAEMFGSRAVVERRPKRLPTGTSGSSITIRGAKFFESEVDVTAYFGDSGLAVIRLKYRRNRSQNLDELLAFYEPKWGAAIKTVDRDGSHKKRTYSWPWEGVEFKSVEDDGKLEYQRVDYSAAVIEDWRRADAIVCAMLPRGSGCPFPDTYCPQQDSSMPKGRKSQEVRVLQSTGEASCVYKDFWVQDARIVFERPTERAAKWLKAVLVRRLGAGSVKRKEGTSEVHEITSWEDLGVRLILIRRAIARTKTGWTGPIEQVRLKRVYNR
jgi:hypothetical protein